MPQPTSSWMKADQPTRRSVLAGVGSLAAWAAMPRWASAARRDPRLVVVILRGAMDGLAVVPPVGDPNYVARRGEAALGSAGGEATLRLDGVFGLNDALSFVHGRYAAGEALIIHATATGYRERSHFDGQEVLETGMRGPRLAETGWLNRAVAALPQGNGLRPASGLATSPAVPLIMRGAAKTLTWTPDDLAPVTPDTIQRLMGIYQHQDARLAEMLQAGLDTEALAAAGMMTTTDTRVQDGFRRLAAGAAKLLREEEGPRIAALSFDGWDTHTKEGAENGRLARLLAALDGGLATLASDLGPVWRDTVVIGVTVGLGPPAASLNRKISAARSYQLASPALTK